MARLKAFTSQQGFYETVVAVPSQKAALEAWGAHQDLFASGAARITTDEAAAKAALAKPGTVLRRAVGSSGDFEEEGGLEGLKLPPAPKRPPKAKAAPARSLAPEKPPPDRGALTAAEQALSRRRDAYEQARRKIDARRKALDEETERLSQTYGEDREALEAARAKAAADYKRAGG